MSKTKTEVKEDKISKEDEVKNAIESLKVQLAEHKKQAEHHTTMAVKAQGALEVLVQLHPETNNNSGAES